MLGGSEWLQLPDRFIREESTPVARKIRGCVGFRTGHDISKKLQICYFRDSKPGYPAGSPVTISTELSAYSLLSLFRQAVFKERCLHIHFSVRAAMPGTISVLCVKIVDFPV
jgi:hypothetical protein